MRKWVFNTCGIALWGRSNTGRDVFRLSDIAKEATRIMTRCWVNSEASFGGDMVIGLMEDFEVAVVHVAKLDSAAVRVLA